MIMVEGMRQPCAGSMDRRPPKDNLWRTFPHRLFFGREQTATWGPGGVAFLYPESNDQDKAYLCMYKITLEQFNDVLRQENLSGTHIDASLFNASDLQSIESKKCIALEAIKRGWYHNVLYLGKENDIPILTMTCTVTDAESFKSGKFPICPPCKEYAATLIKGLVEGKQLSIEEATGYIEAASTKPL